MRRKAVTVLLGVVVALAGGACAFGDEGPTVVTSVPGSTTDGSTTGVSTTGGSTTTAAAAGAESGTAESSAAAPPADTGFTGSPSRDDANVDARDFQVGPDRFAFVSPSRNIYCAVSTAPDDPAGSVGCQAVTSVRAANGTVCDNSATDSYAVRIDSADVTQFCTNQGIYVGGPDVRTLEYGQVLMVQGTPCASSTTGISCWGTGDSGFMISRDINTTLG